ncbi:MAG: TraB/GumN family protein [Verrucomicrobiaceae bacterium]|nr:TraB/GumN family protein [Verrucomicrobiaceae bacterium]
MRTLRCLSTLLALLAGAPVGAEAQETAMAPVWKITDADSTVYLAGSVHLLREKDFPLPAVFDRIYAGADELVFEIDMAGMQDPDNARELVALGSLPEGETLADKLSAATMQQLHAYLEKHDMPRGLFDRFTPGMAYLTLGSIEAMRGGAKPQLGLEMIYYGKSVADGKPSRGLETAAYQISLFDEFEAVLIEQLLVEALEKVEDSAEIFDAIVAAWRSGDAEALGELILEQTDSHPRLREVLLTDRNRNWIPEIEKHLATDRDVLFLVGAGHLVGENSVVDLLRKKGYEVTQLGDDE